MTDLVRPGRADLDAALWRPTDLPLIPTGHEWWENASPHVLAAAVAEAVTHREVVEVSRWQLPDLRYGSLVRPLKPRPPAWRKPVLIGGLVLAAAGGAAWALTVVLRTVVATASAAGGVLLALLVLWLLASAVKGHPCRGIHCAGCGGA